MTVTADPRNDTAPGPHGAVDVRVYEPAGTPAAALVWVHGGGFAAGDLDMPESDAVAKRLQEDGVLVVAVGYRLAGPGTHYPVPSDDVLAAWAWGRDLALAAGVAPDRVQLGGASAGGNLVAGAVLRLLADGGDVPRAVFLAYPTLHAVPPQDSPAAARAVASLPPEQRWSPADVAAMYRGFLGPDAGEAPAAAVPGTADLTGFPPTFVLTSEADGLRGSADEFARRLVLAGTPVLSVCEPGTEHGHLNEPGPRFDASLRRVAHWVLNAPVLVG
ncbi:alpha/beta hydrolase fold domain-containing protein [Kineococcus aurantiacus]|uniref:Acetyl esterase/lipase n=1 Tax=Kineococcus aurantiacus TaxID=37633 RepID=A0A7Y9J1B8_9ACTN|nr:acetyl esterase/lipase [Kineococcus aurantiacus]